MIVAQSDVRFTLLNLVASEIHIQRQIPHTIDGKLCADADEKKAHIS
jgi:hypothetical protein